MSLLKVESLSKAYPPGRLGGALGGFARSAGPFGARNVGPARYAVDGVDFAVDDGETFALVGESGCGKTTVARMVTGLLRPTGGHVFFGGEDVWRKTGRGSSFRREVQMVFQDPASALDPRQRVADAVGEPLYLHRSGGRRERANEVGRLLAQVGLALAEGRRFPHQLSGGQKQRVLIARALALRPRLVVLDEPVSALDVSVRAQILNLLADLQDRYRLAYLFISHDLAVVRRMAGRAGVMHAGRIVEMGPVERLWLGPAHPYTKTLLEAAPFPSLEKAWLATPGRRPPVAERRRAAESALVSERPDGGRYGRSSSCLYFFLCPLAEAACRRRRPVLTAAPGSDPALGHVVACHFPLG